MYRQIYERIYKHTYIGNAPYYVHIRILLGIIGHKCQIDKPSNRKVLENNRQNRHKTFKHKLKVEKENYSETVD